MLCINIDTSSSLELLHSVKQFMESYNLMPAETNINNDVEEKLDLPIVSFADSVIEKTIAESGIPPKRMTTEIY